MPNTAIQVEGIGKRYRLGERERYLALRDVISRTAKAPFRLLRPGIPRSKRQSDILWALKDISFEIKHGEAVGIIGRNGAGKSTLLKILSRITEPTEGRGEVSGRVGSLLEVGTGFHPELTGRDNMFLSGAILGMTKADIRKRFDEIVGFAELARFIDTPVKYYSSGMYIRLAFSVAAHMEPDVLLVDEVLAVGDAEFQKRCLGRMGDLAGGGRTVLFVSHNMAVVKALTQRSLWLDQGRIRDSGPSATLVDKYLATVSGQTHSGEVIASELEAKRVHGAQYLQDVMVEGLVLRNNSGATTASFPENSDVLVDLRVRCKAEAKRLYIRMPVTTPEGLLVFELVPGLQEIDFKPGFYQVHVRFSLGPLLPGRYQAEIVLETKNPQDRIRPAFDFEITPNPAKDSDMYTLMYYPTGDVASRGQLGILKVRSEVSAIRREAQTIEVTAGRPE